jgi:NAD(P)-dependent dehydrogenase (short-subunit alcohol dehydrogenase family)
VPGAPESPAIGLAGAVVLVTGGVRGVGAGITQVFRRAGAQVVTCARHESDAPDFVRADVRRPGDVDRLIATILDRHGRLDVVVNNAGGSPYAPAADASPNFHRAIVELNLLAPLLVSQAANTVMQAQAEGGSIVMVGSVSGVRPSPGTAAYGAAKAGLHNITSTLAVEWAPKVRVNAMAVGMVRTDSADWQYDERTVRTVPLGRLAEPEEIGMCALFLASPMASYVTGATLTVHGGGA